jgi:hypothetical protein
VNWRQHERSETAWSKSMKGRGTWAALGFGLRKSRHQSQSEGPILQQPPRIRPRIRQKNQLVSLPSFLEGGDCKCRCCKMELWVRGKYAVILSPPAPPEKSRVPIPPHVLPGSGKPLDPKLFQQDSRLDFRRPAVSLRKQIFPEYRSTRSYGMALLWFQAFRLSCITISNCTRLTLATKTRVSGLMTLHGNFAVLSPPRR